MRALHLEDNRSNATPIVPAAGVLSEWQRRHLEWRSLVRDMEHFELDPPRTLLEHVGKTKMLALILYAFAGPDGMCRPGIDRLGREINMGRTATKERLARLEKLGLLRIAIVARGRPRKGQERANTYQLIFPEKRSETGSEKQSGSPSKNSRSSDHEVVQEVVVAPSPHGEGELVVEKEGLEAERLAAHPVGGFANFDRSTDEHAAPERPGAASLLDVVRGHLHFIKHDLIATNGVHVRDDPLPWACVEMLEDEADEPLARERTWLELRREGRIAAEDVSGVPPSHPMDALIRGWR